MKRTHSLLVVAILAGWLVVPTAAYAWQEDPAPTEDPAVEAATDEEETEEPDADEEDTLVDLKRRAKAHKGQRGGDDPRRLTAQITKLREVMQKKLDLSSEQKERLAALFDDHLQALKQRQQDRKLAKGSKTDETDIRALRQEMVAAREAGDLETVKELRRKMHQARQKRRQGRPGGMARFLDKVRSELNDEQSATFDRILKRLKLDRFGPPRDQPLSNLMRAIRRPEIGLSPDQLDQLRQLMSEAFRSITPGGDARDRLAGIAKELQEKISEVLTPGQREKLQDLLAQGDGERRHRRGARPRPVEGGGEPPADVAADDEPAGEPVEEPDGEDPEAGSGEPN